MESLATVVTSGSPVGVLWARKVGGDVFCAPAGMVASMLGVDARLVRNTLCSYVNPLQGNKDSVVSLLDLVMVGDLSLETVKRGITKVSVAVENAKKDSDAALSIRKHKASAQELISLCEKWDLGSVTASEISPTATRVRKTLQNCVKGTVQYTGLPWHPLVLFLKVLGRPRCLGLDPPKTLLPLHLSRPAARCQQLTESEAATRIQATYRGSNERSKHNMKKTLGASQIHSPATPGEGLNLSSCSFPLYDSTRLTSHPGRSLIMETPHHSPNPPTPLLTSTSVVPINATIHSRCVEAYHRRLGSPSLSQPVSRAVTPSPKWDGGASFEPGSPLFSMSPAKQSVSPALTPPGHSRNYSPARPVKLSGNGNGNSLEQRVLELLENGERLHEEIKRERRGMSTLPGTPRVAPRIPPPPQLGQRMTIYTPEKGGYDRGSVRRPLPREVVTSAVWSSGTTGDSRRGSMIAPLRPSHLVNRTPEKSGTSTMPMKKQNSVRSSIAKTSTVASVYSATTIDKSKTPTVSARSSTESSTGTTTTTGGSTEESSVPPRMSSLFGTRVHSAPGSILSFDTGVSQRGRARPRPASPTSMQRPLSRQTSGTTGTFNITATTQPKPTPSLKSSFFSKLAGGRQSAAPPTPTPSSPPTPNIPMLGIRK